MRATEESSDTDLDGWDLERLIAQRDRASAALERLEACIARKRADQYLQETYRDGLTGALQRAAGRQRLADEVARAHRAGSSLVVVFLDVVGLKAVNDTYGHATGDIVLAAVGSALIAGLRGYDVVVRYGGDEFVCGLPDSTIEGAERRITQIRSTLALSSPGVQLTCGLAELRPEDSLDDVIARADRAMYHCRGKKVQGVTGGGPPRAVPEARRG